MGSVDKTQDNSEAARQYLDEMNDLVLIAALTTGRIIEANERGCAELGWHPDQVTGKSLREFVHPQDRDALSELGLAIQTNKAGRYTQRWLERGTGAWHEYDVFACLLDEERVMVYGRKASHPDSSTAQTSELLKLFELTDDLMLVSDENGKIQQLNSAAVRLHGPNAQVGTRLEDFVHPDGREAFSRIPGEALRNNNRTTARVAVLTADGGKAILDMSTVYDPEARRWYTVERDVTDQVRSEDQLRALNVQLRKMAERDGLTNVLARQSFEEVVSRRIDAGDAIALVMIDVDDFKSANDRLGHSIGDQLLVNIAETLLAHAGPGDEVGRIGGDEFAMLLQVHVGLHAQLGAINRALNNEWMFDGRSVHSTCSAGVALMNPAMSGSLPDSSGRVQAMAELFRHADLALYKAKERGRNRLEMFEPSFSHEVQRQYEVAAELHLALASGHISAAVQGIFSCATMQLTGFEALARWHHPERGLLLPADFLGAVEDAGLLDEVNAAVIESALSALAPHLNGSELRLAINFSPGQLRDPEMPGRLQQHLARFGVKPSSVTVEITEVGLPRLLVAALPTMERLRVMGFHLAIDDFGLGAASLSAVRDYPITALKVAGDFTTNINEDPYAHAISASVASLGRKLGIAVTAECVENKGHLDTVLRLGFDAAQGHYLHRPATPDGAAQLASAATQAQPGMVLGPDPF